MERIQKILNHPLYQEQFKLLQDAEKDREFCRHTMEHFVDVARLMYIYTLEEKTNVSKELIYAAALLHDIGRYEQISLGTPHHISGARIADEIMTFCDFSKEEVIQVAEAIAGHRKNLLRRILFLQNIFTVQTNSLGTVLHVRQSKNVTGRIPRKI